MADRWIRIRRVALAWQQAGWADYSGVGRTLQALTQAEAEAIVQVLREISQPLIDEQVTQALATQGRLIYDGDLTGRPVSNTSTTYPEAAFGHMDDEVRLGYQAAVVSVGSPHLWPALARRQAASGQPGVLSAGRRTGLGGRSQYGRAALAADRAAPPTLAGPVRAGEPGCSAAGAAPDGFSRRPG